MWLWQSVGYETHFIAEFKDRLICCYKQNWHSEMESDDKYKWFYSFTNAHSKLKIFNVHYKQMFARYVC